MKELPSWTILDPEAPPGLAELSGGGHVVGIVATQGAHAGGWATGVAAQVAEAWSAGGIRLILADGALSDPRLHTEVGIENGEGISDALVFGASVRRVARRVEGKGYFVVAAGTVVADPAEAMSGGRWADLCSGFRAAGVMLAVYLDADDPCTATALREVSQVLVVAGEGEEIPPVVTDCSAPVIGILGVAGEDAPLEPVPDGLDAAASEGSAEPMAGFTEGPEELDSVEMDLDLAPQDGDAPSLADLEEEPVHAELPVEPALSGGDEALEAPLHDGEAALFDRAMQGVEDEEGETEVAALEEILEETEGPKRGGRRTALLMVLLLVIVGALTAEWFGYIEIPGLVPLGSETAPPTQNTAPTETPTPRTEQAPMQGYSVALASYGDAEAAQALLDRLAAVVPDVLFMVVPVEVDGRAYYRALAGPATDSVGAAALMETIASATGSDASQWVLRPTPRAFEMGEMPDLAAASQRAEELLTQDVPAYVLAVDYSDGSSTFRVYAGAFADEAEASLVLRHLTDSGLGAAHLSDRKGRLPE